MTQDDISSPTVLLTGSTSGIGAQMLRALAVHRQRPTLVLLGRNEAALRADIDFVHTFGLTARGIVGDLGDLASVHDALGQLVEAQAAGDLRPIDVAILNAGAQFTSADLASAQGHELTFAVNVIAQHLLARGLEPLLAPDAHVVFMGSSTHRGKRQSFNLIPDPQWRDPAELASPAPPGGNAESGGVAYASSKLALVTLSHDWAERLAAGGRRLNVYDPGLVPGTGLGKAMPGYKYWVWKNLMPVMRVLPGASSPANSGRHAVELAMGEAHAERNDSYIEIGRVTRAEHVTFALDRREALWGWLENAIREFLPSGVASR